MPPAELDSKGNVVDVLIAAAYLKLAEDATVGLLPLKCAMLQICSVHNTDFPTTGRKQKFDYGKSISELVYVLLADTA